jgi:hypothetical protein
MQLDLQYDEKGIDYSIGAFTKVVRLKGCLYPVQFIREFVNSEHALHLTGRVIVMMVHPDYGNITFYLKFYSSEWYLDIPPYREEQPSAEDVAASYDFELDTDLLQWCSDCLVHRDA